MKQNTLIRIPVAQGESLEDYIMRAGQQAIADNRAIVATIDRTITKGYKAYSTTDAPKPKPTNGIERARDNRKTLADLAQDNEMLRNMMRNGYEL